VLGAAGLALGLWASPARAEEPWADDAQVLAARRVRVSAGVGTALFNHARLNEGTVYALGSGLSLEEAVGLGHGLEIGARFGLRTDEAARGLRADGVARGFDTQTFGTGQSTVANPELRLRLRALRWSWGEAGFEDRIVLPIKPDPAVTEVLSAWISIHRWHRVRVDAAMTGWATWQSLAGHGVLDPGFAVPVSVWANVSPRLFAGIITSTQYLGGTPYSRGAAKLTLGLGIGYRLGSCDVTEATYLLDVLDGGTNRIGLGVGLTCRL
jgi:hypothetical protein